MKIADMIPTLKQRGVTFAIADDGRLQISPVKRLKPEEIDLLRQHRDEVLAFVVGERAVTTRESFGDVPSSGGTPDNSPPSKYGTGFGVTGPSGWDYDGDPEAAEAWANYRASRGER